MSTFCIRIAVQSFFIPNLRQELCLKVSQKIHFFSPESFLRAS